LFDNNEITDLNDPLRNDPRFKKLVESFGPNTQTNNVRDGD